MLKSLTYTHKFASSRMFCPYCLGEEFDVEVVGTKRVMPDEECDNGDTSYDDKSHCKCLTCRVEMPVAAFRNFGWQDTIDIPIVDLRPQTSFKVVTNKSDVGNTYTTLVIRQLGQEETTIAQRVTGSKETADRVQDQLQKLFCNAYPYFQSVEDNVRKVLEKNLDLTFLPHDCEISNFGYNWEKWKPWDGANKNGPTALKENLVTLCRRSPDATGWVIGEAHKVDWTHTGGPEDVIYYREVKYGA